MTEWGIGISGSPRLPQERVEATDGVPIEGCEVRAMESPDKQAEPEQEGELQIRGAGLFVGYYERPEYTEEEIVDGWFWTGDQAMVHEDGYVSLLGRTKDIIIRGGENIPVYELENSLYRHPVVVDAAVIGVPDERLGERERLRAVGPARVVVDGVSEDGSHAEQNDHHDEKRDRRLCEREAALAYLPAERVDLAPVEK